MNERKFHKLIEKQNAEEKEAVRQRLQAELGLCKTAERKSFFVRNKRWLFALAACFVCVAIVVPVSLQYLAVNKKIEGGGDDEQPRYCTSADYEVQPFMHILKDYSHSLEEPFLYLNWYEFGEVCKSNAYVDKEQGDILCISEQIFNLNTGDDVTVSVSKKNIVMDFIDENRKLLVNSTKVDSVEVVWLFQNIEAKAYFECGEYCYYLYLYFPMSEQTIFDVVQQMLETAVAA